MDNTRKIVTVVFDEIEFEFSKNDNDADMEEFFLTNVGCSDGGGGM